MSTSNSNPQEEIECVLISDEDDDVTPELKLPNKPATFNSIDVKPIVGNLSNFLLDDGDGRRVSRRRKNKNDSDDGRNVEQSRNAGRSNGNDHTNDAYKNSPHSNASGERKFGISGGGSGAENRAETRSRKRERTPSPVPIDAREIQYKEILSGLEGAAFQSRFVSTAFPVVQINYYRNFIAMFSFFRFFGKSRLPFEKMTSGEASSFADITKNGLAAQRVFLNIRNRLLQMWIEDPKTQLTFENALKRMEKPFDSDAGLVRKIHEYLERHGFINFGIFQRLKPIPTKKLGKVIVIGAGISGESKTTHISNDKKKNKSILC